MKISQQHLSFIKRIAVMILVIQGMTACAENREDWNIPVEPHPEITEIVLSDEETDKIFEAYALLPDYPVESREYSLNPALENATEEDDPFAPVISKDTLAEINRLVGDACKKREGITSCRALRVDGPFRDGSRDSRLFAFNPPRKIVIKYKIEEILFWYDQNGHFVALEVPSGKYVSQFMINFGIEKGQYLAYKSKFDMVLRKQDLEWIAKEKVKEKQKNPLEDRIYYYKTSFIRNDIHKYFLNMELDRRSWKARSLTTSVYAYKPHSITPEIVALFHQASHQ